MWGLCSGNVGILLVGVVLYPRRIIILKERKITVQQKGTSQITWPLLMLFPPPSLSGFYMLKTSFIVVLWRKKWQPTPVFLPGELHGQRSPADPVRGVTKIQTRPRDSHTHTLL